MKGRFAALVFLLGLTGACREAPPPADLVLRRGTIVTLDPAHPRAEALAARGDRIVALGSEEEIQPLIGPQTRVLDLAGKTAYPGFIEGHGHLTGLGRARRTVDVSHARTWEEVVEAIRQEAERRPPGSWILGWGWHQEKWDHKPEPNIQGYPTHAALSRAVPDHPVLLKHASGGHLAIVNAAAMKLARMDRHTPNPPGGELLHDAGGEPTGVLRENAYGVAWEAYQTTRTPEQKAAETRLEVAVAMEECLRKGITSFQDLHSPFMDIDVFRAMADEGKLPVRLYVMVMERNDVLRARLKDYRWIGLDDGHLTVRAIKKQIDGALGSHGAWLLEPYVDLPSSTGFETENVADIEETADIALEHGFQLAVHAIGDRANRETLDLYERAFRKRPPKESPRFRIEHVQLLHPVDVPRFKQLGVLASMQGIHCTSDGPWVPTRIGEDRARERGYVWRGLIDAGARVNNGTDAPVEDPDPIPNFAASVTRRIADGRTFYPEQCMTREEALRSITVNAAYAAFEEDVKGTLQAGRYADVTVLTQNLLTVPGDAITQTKVAATIVGGRILYEAR